jgi:glyoxylase-like metal-dependent hydrolase (beta-lactamase superfamily II)
MSWQVGDVRVTRILEQDFALPPSRLLSQFNAAQLAKHAQWLMPHFMGPDGQLLMSFQALLVESRDQRIIVDTCRGNDRPLPNGRGILQSRFLTELEEIVSRHSIDFVLCTHLHYDHVGWNTMLDKGVWIPTFPNARYLFCREEYEYWSTAVNQTNVDLHFAIEPILKAGMHELVEPGHRITDEVHLESTPGHTPGHVSVRIVSRSEQALITGDFVHHPVQLVETSWSSYADVQPELAVRTRLQLVDSLKNKPILIIGTHFSDPTAGHLVADGLHSSLRVKTA